MRNCRHLLRLLRCFVGGGAGGGGGRRLAAVPPSLFCRLFCRGLFGSWEVDATGSGHRHSVWQPCRELSWGVSTASTIPALGVQTPRRQGDPARAPGWARSTTPSLTQDILSPS